MSVYTFSLVFSGPFTMLNGLRGWSGMSVMWPGNRTQFPYDGYWKRIAPATAGTVPGRGRLVGGIVSNLNLKPVSVLTEDEVRALAGVGESLTAVRDRALIWTLYYTALRVSEALALEVGDLDPARNCLLVREGKGGKSRVVGMPPQAYKYICLWLAARRTDGAAVFTTHQGGRLSRRQVDAMLKRHAVAGGVSARVHAHALRHSFASAAVERGLHIEFIRRQLGHAHLQTTQQYLRGIGSDRFVDAVVGMWD